MLSSLALVGLASVSLALSAPGEIETHALRHAPAAGTRVETRVTTMTQMDSNRFEVVMNGNPVPAEFLPPLDVSYAGAIELVVEDRYGEVAPGRPLSFTRSYETFKASSVWDAALGDEYEDEAGDLERTAEVEGAEVEFRWNEQAGEYDRALVGSEERPAALAKLDARLDLAGFLPAGDVAVGDVWELDAALVDRLLAPGGDLDLQGSSAPDIGDSREVESAGELSARLVSVEDGRAVVEFEGEHTSSVTFRTNLDRVPVVDGTATQRDTMKLDLKGRLVWGVAEGRAASLSLDGVLEFEQHTIKDEGQDGPAYESTLGYAGECTVRVEFATLAD